MAETLRLQLSWRAYFIAVVLTLLCHETRQTLLAHEGHQPLPSKGVLVDTSRGYITLTKPASDAIGLRTEEVVVGEVSSTLSAYAETVASWQAKAYGSAQISGSIHKLLVRPGDEVAKNQIVAELSSRELESLRLEYQQAKKNWTLNQQLLEMARPSAKAGAIPMQRLLELENAFQQSENATEIARLRTRALGIQASELDRSDTESLYHVIRSPIAGKVVHSDLSEGKFVDAFEHLFEIVNNDETWVRIQILEKDVFKVSLGQRVVLQFVDAGVKVTGNIDRIDAGLDPKSKVSWAWVTISHPDVVPGLVGSATITTTTQSDRMVVPRRSVFSDGLQTYLFVEVAATKSSAEFQKRNVTLGSRGLSPSTLSNPMVEIAQGDVYPGDRVVVTGGHELSSLFFLGVLKLTDSDRKRLGILTATATMRPIVDAIHLAGQVTLPPQNRSTASSQLAGTIHSHTLSPGKAIRAGELLMEIASPEFYTLQLDFLKTSLDANLSRLRAQRLEDVKDDAFSRRLILETLAQADQLQGRVDSLRRQLLSLGLSAVEVDSMADNRTIYDYFPIRAQIDGRLISWSGTLGETVVANQQLVEIHDLSAVWLEAYVPPHLMPAVSQASQGQASVLSNPEIQFPVKVTRVGPIVSQSTRTGQLWLVPIQQETPLLLRDQMQVTVSLRPTDSRPGLTVPANAVLRDGSQAFIFVQKSNDDIERRRVKIGRSDGEFIEIIQGVVAGESVISAGGRELQTAFASLR